MKVDAALGQQGCKYSKRGTALHNLGISSSVFYETDVLGPRRSLMRRPSNYLAIPGTPQVIPYDACGYGGGVGAGNLIMCLNFLDSAT